MEVMIICGCNSFKSYKYSNLVQERHYNSKCHQDWIVQNSENLYTGIKVICPCGKPFDYYTQLQHLKSTEHQLWQNVSSDRMQMMPFICGCSNIVPYGKLKEHRVSHIIPNFVINNR